ncbi:hypothetical protein BH10BAC2_BH10BAC2_48360 [soil metagenome]
MTLNMPKTIRSLIIVILCVSSLHADAQKDNPPCDKVLADSFGAD